MKKYQLYLIVFFLCVPTDLVLAAEMKCDEDNCVMRQGDMAIISDFKFPDESEAWERHALAAEGKTDRGHIVISSSDTFKEKKKGLETSTAPSPLTAVDGFLEGSVWSQAKKGQVEAQFALAEACYFGEDIEKNLPQAFFWYEKAAQQGHPKAQRALGAMYLLGKGTAKEPEKAAYWYQKSAEQGIARAQTNLGILFETGVGVAKKYDTARSWYEKAAAQNYARGQTNLGRMYELGRGVEVDFVKAFFWYEKAAQQGYARAQTNLGALYESGQGVEQNYKQASAWYTKAARQHYARGQFYLGRLYEQGLGVEKNIALASEWYSKAAKQGYSRARKQLDKAGTGYGKTDDKIIQREEKGADLDQEDGFMTSPEEDGLEEDERLSAPVKDKYLPVEEYSKIEGVTDQETFRITENSNIAGGSQDVTKNSIPWPPGLQLKEGRQDEMASTPATSDFEYMRGSTRSLKVPFIELPTESSKEIVAENMPPVLIVVDGLLDDTLWNKAVVSGDFWLSLENKPPTDQTEVLVASDNNYLYFAFRLHDSKPEEIQATKTVRDTGLGYDDSITIELDTFFNRRDISEFSLNPLGTQNDDIAGGRSSKVEWKGDWLGAAARTDDGWTAEFAIPFAILNYQQENTVFGINFKRYQSRTKEYSWWADVTPKNLPEEMGQLQGIKLPTLATSERKSWTFMPFVLAGKNIPDKEGEIKDTLFTGGIDIRYQPRSDLTGMLSLNPDFSQVEKAVTDISFSYSEKSIDDNRPFFIEGGKYFTDDDEYFYSNRVADFDFGGKGFGRFGNTKFGILATSAPDDRYDAVGRVLHELNDTHSAIVTLAGTSQSTFDNALAVAQFKGSQTRTSTMEYSLDAAISNTSKVQESGIPEGQGSHFQGMLGWKSDYWYLKTNMDQYDVDYFPALALLKDSLPGTWATSTTGGYYRERSDSFWRVIDSYAGFKYRLTKDDVLQERKWFIGGSVEFENQIRTTFYIDEGPYRPVTDVRGIFEDYTNDDRYYSAAVDFNTRSSVSSIGVQYDWGHLGGGDYEYIAAYAWWRPIQQVYLNLTGERTDSFGVYKQIVLSGSWEITPEDSLGARYIYYESDYASDNYFRVAYGRKARKGLDIFAVYNKDPYQDDQYSLKLVYTF